MKYSKTINKLTEMANFLRSHKRYDYANMIEDYLINFFQKDLILNDKEKFKDVFLTVFGGSGSIHDLYLCEQNGDVSDDFNESNKKLEVLKQELFQSWNEEIGSRTDH